MNNVEKRHEYYIKNKEKIRGIARKNYYKNHEKKLLHNKIYREKNKDKIRKYYREWYAKNGRGRNENYIEAILEWRQMFPEKVAAYVKFQKALRKGNIIRAEKCQRCQRLVRTQGHHANYENVLKVEWLCASCHKLEHSSLRG